MKHAPKKLNEIGRKYWYDYIKDIQQTRVNLHKLEDLCYWEQRKEEAQKELEEAGSDIVVYRDESGKIKHTQPIAMMINLRNAQDKINSLRNQLFGQAENKKTQFTPKSRARSDDDFTKIRKLK